MYSIWLPSRCSERKVCDWKRSQSPIDSAGWGWAPGDQSAGFLGIHLGRPRPTGRPWFRVCQLRAGAYRPDMATMTSTSSFNLNQYWTAPPDTTDAVSTLRQSLSGLAHPPLQISRVAQLDADLLDNELEHLLVAPIRSSLASLPVSRLGRFSAEAAGGQAADRGVWDSTGAGQVRARAGGRVEGCGAVAELVEEWRDLRFGTSKFGLSEPRLGPFTATIRSAAPPSPTQPPSLSFPRSL